MTQGGSGTGSTGRIAPPTGNLLANGDWFAEMRRDITADPIDPNSAALIALHGTATLHIDFAGPNGQPETNLYGVPYNVLSIDFPRVPVSITDAAESDPGPVPIDPNGSFQSVPPGGDLTVTPTGDRHYIALLQDANGNPVELWEVYQPVLQTDGSWKAEGVAKWDMMTGKPRPLSWTSADAAGMAMLPLMLKQFEVASGDVGHAIRCTFGATVCAKTYAWPGRHSAGFGATSLLPFGGRLRLRQDWYDANKANFSGQARVILDAMRKYGLINADITGNTLSPFVSGVTDDRWDWNTGDAGDILSLQKVPVAAFEMIQVHPEFTVMGPTSLVVGQSYTFTVQKRLPDSNFSGTCYIYEGPAGASLAVAQVPLNDASPSGTFQYTPKSAGTVTLTALVDGFSLAQPSPPLSVTVAPPTPIAYKTVKDGWWGDATCYSPIGLPTAIDSLTFAHNLTMKEGESWSIAAIVDAGGSVATTGASLSVMNAAASTLGRNLEEPLRTPLSISSTPSHPGVLMISGILTIQNNAVLKFQGVPPTYKADGTLAAPAVPVIVQGAGGVVTAIQSTTVPVNGLVRSWFCDESEVLYRNLGDAATNVSGVSQLGCASTQDQAPCRRHRVTFQNCHNSPDVLVDSEYSKGQVDAEHTECRWINCTGYNGRFRTAYSPNGLPITTGKRLIARCSAPQTMHVGDGGYQDGWQIQSCTLLNSIMGHPSNRVWAGMDDCFIQNADAVLKYGGGDVTNCLYVFDAKNAIRIGHYWCRSPMKFSGNIGDVLNSDGSQYVWSSSEGGYFGDYLRMITGNIVTTGSGRFCHLSSPWPTSLPGQPTPLSHFRIEHNTIGVFTGQPAIQCGDTQGMQAGTVDSLRNNLFCGAGIIFANKDPHVPQAECLPSANAHHNGLWQIVAPAYQSPFPSGGTPGASDVVADPKFVDISRHVWNYLGAASLKYVTDRLAVQYFPDDPLYDPNYTTDKVMAWIRGGYVPQNAGVLAASDDGTNLGAVQGSVPPPPATVTLPLNTPIALSSGGKAFTITIQGVP